MSQTVSSSNDGNEVSRGDIVAASRGDDLDGLETAYTGFSCPFELFDQSFADLIAGEYARSVLGLFVEQFNDVLAEGQGGLEVLFSRLLNVDLPFELAWSSALGNLYGAARVRDAARARKEAAAFALLASAQGIPAEWQLTLTQPTALMWDDWVMPECDELSVAADGTRAVVNLALRGDQQQISFTFQTDGSGWQCDTPGQIVRLPTFGSGSRRLVLLPRSAALSSGFFGDADDAINAMETFPPLVMETLTGALDLLERHVPHYFEWVVRIIRRVTVLHSPQDLLRSGSHENHHGTIHISDNLRVLSVAEMLIHEASHQYLELLHKLGPTVDPAHQQLYYSPIKQCDRPLHKILLAYHAFANVMLFYRDMIERDLADEFLDNLKNILADELRQLEAPLRENTDVITPIGLALVEPLIKRGVCQ